MIYFIGCYPTSWTIKAKVSANDEWTTIAAESNNNTMSDEQTCHSYLFDFDNPGNNAYKYFRFEVTAVEGWEELGDEWTGPSYHYWLELAEMQMYVRGETLETLAAHSDDNGNYWATYYNGTKSYAADFNTTIYKGAVSDNKVLLTAVDDIPAGNAVILKSKASPITLTLTSATTADFTGNDLQGRDHEVDASGMSYAYCLSKGANGVGFYKYTGNGGSNIIPAHRAFLEIGDSGSNAPRRFYGFDEDNGEATSVSEELKVKSDESTVYDLQGRQIVNGKSVNGNLQPGMYIVNGKKVFIK